MLVSNQVYKLQYPNMAFALKFHLLKRLIDDEDSRRIFGDSFTKRFSPSPSPENSEACGSHTGPLACSYRTTGPAFEKQSWWHCYSCYGSQNDSGVCYSCAVTCHSGHLIVFSRSSRFYCDCGAKQSCRCLKTDAIGRKRIGSIVQWANNLKRSHNIPVGEGVHTKKRFSKNRGLHDDSQMPLSLVPFEDLPDRMIADSHPVRFLFNH